jgi:glycosyltransferase involved in cell wall biosynthesis
MKILLLAPHPFYQERGTPIAVDLLLRAFSGRGDRVDVVTFHEGENRTYPGITIHRITGANWIHNIRPGLSWKKIVCDFFLARKARLLASQTKYDLVHAVEESAFIVMLPGSLHRLPCLFDMDSSLPMQIVEQKPWLVWLAPVLKYFEKLAMRHATAVIAVCEALAGIARANGARKVYVLRDISLLSKGYAIKAAPQESLAVQHPCLMYIGNLEAYQGIDLLLESFALLLKSVPTAFLAIIGGNRRTIADYWEKSKRLGAAERVRFFGPRPLASMAQMFAHADILVSPRIKGTNTPMKIYSYLHSGKPVLATALPTHTQVLNNMNAMLAPPQPGPFAAAMLRLVQDSELRKQLAEKAVSAAEKEFSFASYLETFGEIYREIEKAVSAATLQ